MPVAPCPMPRTKRPMSAGTIEKPPKPIQRNGRAPEKFRSTPPEATARQPNLSVKYPMHGYTHSMPTPMDPRIQPVCVAVRLQPVTKKSGMRNWPPYMIPTARNWVVAAIEKSRILKSSMSISALDFFRMRVPEKHAQQDQTE